MGSTENSDEYGTQEQQEDLPDPEELYRQADELEETNEVWGEALSLLKDLKNDDNLRETTRKKLDFVDEMLGMLKYNDDPGKRAHDTRQYARMVEDKIAQREHEEEAEA